LAQTALNYPGNHVTPPQPDDTRRLSFGAVAEQYDRYRPSYPSELVDDVLSYAGAGPGDRALEVGPGTGRATLLFAARGLQVTAVEPDEAMASVARRRLEQAGLHAEILSADFEAAFDAAVDRPALPEHAFRLLFSATAWHWVDPQIRNRLAARALTPGGALAPFWNRPDWSVNPLRPGLDRAYEAIQCEFSVEPAGPMNPRGLPREYRNPQEWLDSWFDADDRDNDFTDVEARTYRSSVLYTTESYLALIGTHSDHHLLPAEVRDPLFERIARVIDAAGGSFELTYEALLCLARRV
jgi:SAM-dependent methyltransferase